MKRTARVLAPIVAAVLAGGSPSPLCATPGAPCTPPSSAPPAPSTLAERLEAIDRRAGLIRDLSADFEQRKHTPLLKDPLVSTGRVRVKGPRARWDTDRPHPTVMTLDEREVRLYYPDQKTVEVYPVEGQFARLTASPLPRLDAIRAQFSIEEIANAEMGDAAGEGLALELLPLDDPLAEHVQRIRVLIDPAAACITRLEMTDPDGERTVIVFRKIRTDTGIPDAELDLAVPTGTRVSRPLEGISGGGP